MNNEKVTSSTQEKKSDDKLRIGFHKPKGEQSINTDSPHTKSVVVQWPYREFQAPKTLRTDTILP